MKIIVSKTLRIIIKKKVNILDLFNSICYIKGDIKALSHYNSQLIEQLRLTPDEFNAIKKILF